ncbi:MAG: RT0821/Lpp0805 family surface protein [Hyphomicrobiaceae bacterium]
MTLVRVLAVGSVVAMLAACGPNGVSKQDGGAVLGAVTGGVIGNQFGSGSGKVLATAAGAVIGGIVGSEIGRYMDEADRRAAQEAEFAALETGQSGQATPWRNPDSGHYGMVVPGKPFKRDRYDCRDYTHTIYIDGQPQTMRGTACRNPDGTWQNVG